MRSIANGKPIIAIRTSSGIVIGGIKTIESHILQDLDEEDLEDEKDFLEIIDNGDALDSHRFYAIFHIQAQNYEAKYKRNLGRLAKVFRIPSDTHLQEDPEPQVSLGFVSLSVVLK